MTLSISDINLLRSDASNYRTSSAVVERRQTGVSAEGRQVSTWDTVATYACSIMPASAGEIEAEAAANADTSAMMYRVTLPYNADLDIGDRLTIASKKYSVTRRFDAHSPISAIVCFCVEEILS